MSGRLARYGAVAVKVRSLWGLRLRTEDYRRMAAMRTLPELAGYLRAHARWGRALEGVHLTAIHRHELEDHLRRYHLEEHWRLYPYLSGEDQELLDFPVLELELSQIMRYLRLARVGRARDFSYTPPPYIARRSKINYTALSAAETYDALVDAVAATGFAPVLRRLKPKTAEAAKDAENAFPPFTLVEMALYNHYFHVLRDLIVRRGDEDLRKQLLQIIGIQADLINISVILRVKRYYPEMEGQFLSYLLPIRHALRPDTLRRLYMAENADAAIKLLRGTYYGKYFQNADIPLEKLISQIRYDHSVRGIREPIPSVVTPLSFLHLTEVELSNVIHLIECVRYNVPPEEAMTYIVGREIP